ncbi:hypothetical protein SPBRAN_2062 [uncultured Candidatus Thioglobus sp.]|nr:hypothetical protein SPBRAN_2062 [uncultured Candidatus Thioglobus sp.]
MTTLYFDALASLSNLFNLQTGFSRFVNDTSYHLHYQIILS